MGLMDNCNNNSTRDEFNSRKSFANQYNKRIITAHGENHHYDSSYR